MIATVLLAIAMLGIAAAFDTARAAQVTSRERQAALTAASTQLQDLIDQASASSSAFETVRALGDQPFAVVLTDGVVKHEALSDASVTPTGALSPAGSGVWNEVVTQLQTASGDSSLARSGDEALHAGWYVVWSDDPADSSDPRAISIVVVVAWRSAATDGHGVVSVQQHLTDPNH